MSDPSFRDLPPLEIVDGVPVVRLRATPLGFDHAIDMVAEVMRRMVAKAQPHLLVDAREVTFDAPSLAGRLQMARRWADAAGGRVRIVVVARPEFIDPERFGVVAAGIFGLSAQVFEREADAMAWLREEQAAELRRNPVLPGG